MPETRSPHPAGPPIQVGGIFADLDLPDHNGNERSLSDLVAGDPTVLHFYRGWWCPKEQAYLRLLTSWQDELEVAYCRIVSVSVDPPEVQAAWRAGADARWTFLSDADRRWLPKLGLEEATDPTHRPYAPTVAVLAPDLTVQAVYDGYWFLGRPTVEELRADLRAISRRVRPDWSAPHP
ncbi:peroxiredoxin [Sporichthya sp.]|uniref:peroxiredoxin family protein n=1 Tax=Sporichthya sp. TaxID=65475 RepID=UPI0017968A82|nr:redoxin domain-containing protein [Sporichthya sp.]MBA3743219.1 redoxin domain-containing protein [Sporichthya sp.]